MSGEGGPARVLVVEDDDEIRAFVTMALSDEGYQVIPAANGALALDLLTRRHRPGPSGHPDGTAHLPHAAPPDHQADGTTTGTTAADGPLHPHLILLDLRMPVMDGWAFAEAYRRLPAPHAPIVAVTATRDTADSAAQIQADGVLAKPFELDDLLATVARFTQRP